MSSQVRLRLLPSARCFFDEPVQVQVAGLRSRQVVTMKARSTDEKGVVFSSSAIYRADGSGEIDLKRDPSLSGSYVGVEPMGLLWSMRADTLHRKFQKTNALNPHVVKFSVHEEEGEERMLAEANNERLLIGDGVSRLPVKEGNIRGVLFTPPELLNIGLSTANTITPLLIEHGTFPELLVGGAAALFGILRKRRRGRRADALVKLRQRGFLTVLPLIHLNELLLLNRTNSDFCKSSALSFTKSWLTPHIPDSALFLPGFNLFGRTA
ncbi:acyl-coenzyme A thioesterase 1-like isoform X1 [Micropterus dolomieu]|uniref:acyl-coenzyme A thioesterase 1-like isoform X1 n=1 Tax=Micropterus dolomieu TaxID=147949 RepID=UPI001E8E0AB8|nr:acyl-coenzyme A thioesterase 1-like isoform X1 [Micropterus dolomieu]